MPRSSIVNIDIDEVDIGQKGGAIAGIVWDGETPEENILPGIPTHCQSKTHLPKLLSCSRAFPFIMPLQHPCDLAYSYEEILVCSLQMLLGWLIVPRKAKTKVNVYLELYSQWA